MKKVRHKKCFNTISNEWNFELPDLKLDSLELNLEFPEWKLDIPDWEVSYIDWDIELPEFYNLHD
jgi:hypothetical protein